MSKREKRYREPYIQWDDEAPGAEGEPLRLDEVLEPYGSEYGESGYSTYANEHEQHGGADAPEYREMYTDYDAYSDDEQYEQDDHEGRFKVAMSVFNVVSTLVGVLLILVLVGLLLSLFNWLSMDIRHSFVLLQSNLQ